MGHATRTGRFKSATKGLLLLLVVAGVCLSLAAQESKLGVVRGVVQNGAGDPVGGFWLMLVNPALGMNYRIDVDPAGKFLFTDIYPGTYVFQISPYSYTVVSPSYIEVKGGDDQEVNVIVARAPGSTKGFRPETPIE